MRTRDEDEGRGMKEMASWSSRGGMQMQERHDVEIDLHRII